MFTDYHVHLDKLEWNISTINDMCIKARENEVDTLGIVVHTKVLQGFEPLYTHVLSDGQDHRKLVFEKDIDTYIDLLKSAKEKGYPVRIGVEVCYSPEGQDFLSHKLKEYPFDYTIGSVHLIGSLHFKTALEQYRDREKVGRMYYGIVLQGVKSRLFNIIGHIEIARREGIPGLDHYPDILEEICSELVVSGCAVEINTKWLTKHGYLVPDKNTLEYMLRKGVRLVFGSDAHHKTRIGFAREIAGMAIKEAGYRGFSSVD